MLQKEKVNLVCWFNRWIETKLSHEFLTTYFRKLAASGELFSHLTGGDDTVG
jgi:hypothetical protein